MVKILNTDCQVTKLLIIGNQLHDIISWRKSYRLNVTHVQLIYNRTDISGGLQTVTNNLASALLSGFIGLMSCCNKPANFSVDLDIYLDDGRVIELWTDEPKFLRFCVPYMNINDKRQKFRNQRGVK